MRILAIIFLFTTLFAWENSDWLKQVENRVDEDAIKWLRKQINPNERKEDLQLLTNDQCKNCFKGEVIDLEEPKLFVFMSFSVPENIWLSLSQEMKGYHAVFVLRGLPNNSFKSLAQKIAHLKEKGMEASIQIHPNLFKEHAIEKVPAFVFIELNEISKATGAVSLNYITNLFNYEGKT